MADRISLPVPADDVAELEALIERGGFWRLAPERVPRSGHAEATPELPCDVEAGFGRLIA